MTDDLRTQLESKSDDELLNMLHDRESGDWRPEAIAAAEAILAARGVKVPAPAATAHDQLEYVDLVTVATFLTTGEAEPARNALEAAGFHVLAKNIATVYADGVLAPMLGGVRMQVPAEEATDALEFLRSANSGEMAAQAECPVCQSAEHDTLESSDRGQSLANVLVAKVALFDRTVTFRCRACGHEWQ